MSKPIRIPAQAKATADALVQFCTRAGVEYEFLPIGGGGHPTIKMEWGRQSRKMTFAGTPSDKRRGSMNAVSQARRLCREMGWHKPKKEKSMKMGKQGMSMFDAQQASSGAASEVKVLRPNGVRLKGVLFPDCPSHGPKKEAIAARNVAAYEARLGGASISEIHRAMQAAGWDVKEPSVYVYISNEKQRRQGPERRPPPKQSTAQSADFDPLIIEIAKAIAPLLAKRLKPDPEIMAKAEKWDAIKGLVTEA